MRVLQSLARALAIWLQAAARHNSAALWKDPGMQAVVLFLAIALVFARTASANFVLHDDPDYVTENPRVVSGLSWANAWWALTELNAQTSYWHPLTWLSHQTDCLLFGLRPGFHHLTSVWLHALNTCLVLLLLRRLGLRTRLAFMGALFFGLHPLHVESVAWVSERKDVLYGMFWLLAFLAWLAFRRSSNAKWYLGALGAFVCALAAKPTAVTLPALLLVWELVAPDRRETKKRGGVRWWLLLLPFFALSGFSAASTIIGQMQIGAVTGLAALPIAARLDQALVGYAWYVIKFVLPVKLCVSYVRSQPYAPAECLIALALVGALCCWAWRSRAHWPRLGLGWYAVTLLPNIGLVQAGAQSTADRYSYIPMLGLLIAVIGAWQSWKPTPLLARSVSAVTATALVIFGLFSHQQLRFWHDSVALFERAVSINEANWVAQLGLGMALTERGRFEEAVVHLSRARELPGNDAEAERRLAICHLRQGKLELAQRALERALELRPGSAETCFMLAGMLAETARTEAEKERAAELADRGLALRPAARPQEISAVRRAHEVAGRNRAACQAR